MAGPLPKSILKKRPTITVSMKSKLKQQKQQEEEEEIEEVSAEEFVKDKVDLNMNNEESSSDDGEDDSEDDRDSYDDEESDEEDEDEILGMGERPIKSAFFFSLDFFSCSNSHLTDCSFPFAELKHKTLRPTPAPSFSLALNHLLSLPPSTSTLIPKNAPPSSTTLRLERKAKSLIRETKSEHLARGHVRDVIVGWGARPQLPFSQWDNSNARSYSLARAGTLSQGLQGTGVEAEGETGAEREKRLRRLAQRGVVRLFNAIGAAQGAPAKAEEEEKKKRKADAMSEMGSTATTTVGAEDGPQGKLLRRPNVLGGRGKGETCELFCCFRHILFIRQVEISTG